MGLFDGLLGLLSHDVGIDLGTANTLVTVRNRGIVISEPSVVAMDTRTKRVLAIGAEAKRMVGRTPASIIAMRPLRDGVISDFDVTEQMLRYFIKSVHDRYARLPRPRVLVGIPSGVTEVEKRAVRDATINAGARWARLIEEPMAAAIGAGLPVSEPSGSLIVDIGGGTTEVAVVSLGGIVVSRSVRIGGDEMDSDIVSFARREYNLLMGERTAEEIKIAVGSAYPDEKADERTVTFRGRDLLTGLPRSVEVGGDQIREALEPSIAQIVDAIKETIEETPPELVADVMDQGIVLAGGGALLAGLDRRVAEATQMPVHIADDPLTCVVRGTRPGPRGPRHARARPRQRPVHPRTALAMYGPSSPHRRSRAGLWFAAFTIASLLMLLASSTEPAQTLQRVTTRALDPVRQTLSGIGSGVAGLFGTIGEIDRLRGENAELRVALAGAEQRIAELAEAARENGELRQLLGITEALDMELLPVRITSRDPSNFTWEAGVDAGTDDGVRVGMPVVANANGAGALAGTVVSVTEDTARIRFIVDTRSAVIALDQASRALGEVRGQAGGQLVMSNVPVTETVEVGDTIVSAGITFGREASRYPGGLLIGTVQAVEEDDNALTQTAFVRPAFDVAGAERLLIVLDFSQG